MEVKFKRGDNVNFLGGKSSVYHANKLHEKELKSCITYVWYVMMHLQTLYVIQHPDGFPKEYFLAGEGFQDGFESVPSKALEDGKLYAYVEEEQLEKELIVVKCNSCGNVIPDEEIEYNNSTNEEGEEYGEVTADCSCGNHYETSHWGWFDDKEEAKEYLHYYLTH